MPVAVLRSRALAGMHAPEVIYVRDVMPARGTFKVVALHITACLKSRAPSPISRRARPSPRRMSPKPCNTGSSIAPKLQSALRRKPTLTWNGLPSRKKVAGGQKLIVVALIGDALAKFGALAFEHRDTSIATREIEQHRRLGVFQTGHGMRGCCPRKPNRQRGRYQAHDSLPNSQICFAISPRLRKASPVTRKIVQSSSGTAPRLL
jgi:hypothetical protein